MAVLIKHLEVLRNAYKNAREDYTRIQNDIEEIERKWRQAASDPNLSAAGKENARNRRDAAARELRTELRELIRNTQQTFDDERKEVEETFRSAFSMVPEKVDPNGMELLRSGLLTDDELVNLYNKYNRENNHTMIRMIGGSVEEKLKKDRDNAVLSNLAGAIRSVGFPHLEAVDAYTFVCMQALREERSVSDNIDARMQEKVWNEVTERYGSICSD